MEELYFIAIVPPQEIEVEITDFKAAIWEKFNSKHALRSPPHITLHMPFRWKSSKIHSLESTIKKINKGFEPLEIHLDGFGFFEPRVVYVDVVENEALDTLQKQVQQICKRDLNLTNANYKDRTFKPHITIGFRDLKKAMFFEAKAFYQEKSYQRSFKTSEIVLFKYEDSKWKKVIFGIKE